LIPQHHRRENAAFIRPEQSRAWAGFSCRPKKNTSRSWRRIIATTAALDQAKKCRPAGRTASKVVFAFEHWGVTPDIITAPKASQTAARSAHVGQRPSGQLAQGPTLSTSAAIPSTDTAAKAVIGFHRRRQKPFMANCTESRRTIAMAAWRRLKGTSTNGIGTSAEGGRMAGHRNCWKDRASRAAKDAPPLTKPPRLCRI